MTGCEKRMIKIDKKVSNVKELHTYYLLSTVLYVRRECLNLDTLSKIQVL